MNDVVREQIDYYKARAPEYDEWFYRKGRYDHGAEANQRWFAEAEQVVQAFDALGISGHALELAPGTGIWTERLCRLTETVTAVDASPEMVELCRSKLGTSAAQVDFVTADLFEWRPERRYDAVIFGFWISHVPLERLDGFLRLVADALEPGGKVFFVDGRREPLVTASDHVMPVAGVETMTRVLNDGTSFRIVKNYYTPEDLRDRFERAGLNVEVKETETYFIYGYGSPS